MVQMLKISVDFEMKCKTLYFFSKNLFSKENLHFLHDMTDRYHYPSIKNPFIINAERGRGDKKCTLQHLIFLDFGVILGWVGVSKP